MYNKIIDLTQMNIDIYKDIKEVSEKWLPHLKTI
jgi:hypothetical protein